MNHPLEDYWNVAAGPDPEGVQLMSQLSLEQLEGIRAQILQTCFEPTLNTNVGFATVTHVIQMKEAELETA